KHGQPPERRVLLELGAQPVESDRFQERAVRADLGTVLRATAELGRGRRAELGVSPVAEAPGGEEVPPVLEDVGLIRPGESASGRRCAEAETAGLYVQDECRSGQQCFGRPETAAAHPAE